jgi:hypothetical protein
VFSITAKDLAFVNKDLKTVTEKGAFDILIGKEKKRIFYNN